MTEFATTVLLTYMAAMQEALKRPHPLSGFCTPGVGVRTILARLGRSRDFSGCYFLVHDVKPFYVGISRGVVACLRQHGMGTTHFDASLAYRIACERTRPDHPISFIPDKLSVRPMLAS